MASMSRVPIARRRGSCVSTYARVKTGATSWR
jgi:hypothetical protein